MHRHALVVIAALGLSSAPAAAFASTTAIQSPDARDANIAARSAQFVDLRSPDARDSTSVRLVTLPSVEVVRTAPSHAFRWGDAGIGAGGALLIALLAVGVGAGIQHRRRGVLTTRTPVTS